LPPSPSANVLRQTGVASVTSLADNEPL
jgi:hypothetical protein